VDPILLLKAAAMGLVKGATVFEVGLVVSFISAMIVIKALIRFVSRNTFVPFAWYRIVFGLLLIALFRNGRGG
jgi:undecaprenyl-diphosphatase